MDLGFAILLIIFITGYCGIILEAKLPISKGAVALLLAAVLWIATFGLSHLSLKEQLHSHLMHIGSIAQVVFFLMGALAIVELIEAHHGFQVITRLIKTRSKRKLLCLTSLTAFILSAILNNLAAAVLMLTILKKIIPERESRFYAGVLVVLAANAGGSFSPIGDITTTMLWIEGQISTLGIIKALFLPAACCIGVPLLFFLWKSQGKVTPLPYEPKAEKGAMLVFTLGILALLSVPFFKATTGLPPFMGILVALSILWIVTDILHAKYPEREHLRMPSVLTRIDLASLLFIIGILLAVSALETAGILQKFAELTTPVIGTGGLFGIVFGVVSAFVDNIPFVAAMIGMYPLSSYATDNQIWHLVAYVAGNGGSLLIIGSAAGIIFMAMEKVTFFHYLKKVSLPILCGYLAGLGVYFMLR